MFKSLFGSRPEAVLDWETVFKEEVEHLGYNAPGTNSDPNLTGLCLSGGGVRSAIFCGGVVQYLAEEDLLKRFDYLSTVSGGGFTGAALSYWGHSDTRDEAADDNEAHESDAPDVESQKEEDAKARYERPFPHYGNYIRHLRANISYLMPGGFQDALIGAYVVLRSILINVLIYIGLTTGLFHLLLRLQSINGASSEQSGSFARVWAAFVKFLGEYGGNYLFLGLTCLGLVFLVVLVLLFPVFSFGTLWKTESGYLWRKRIERTAGGLLVLTLVALPLGLLPIATQNIDAIYDFLFELTDDEAGQMNVGIIGAIIGSAISIFGLFRARLGGLFGTFSSITVVLGAVLLILSVAILAMHLAQSWTSLAVVILCAFSVSLAVFCNINDVSLGRFYRDRLMEAFMPNKRQVERAGQKGVPLAMSGGSLADQADKLRLTDLKQKVSAEDRQAPPIHLINTNLMSWWAPDSRAQRRKGDNFILSSLFCGSDMTHWKRTEDVAKNRLTLATAMSVSGAAVNPQGGFAGQGPTTSWPVAIAMAFLSLRLGYWLRWTSERVNSSEFGNHIHPGLTQLSKRLFSSEVYGTIDDAKLGDPCPCAPQYLELSDGGHFDNLGLYEMIRRECRVMIVCDGGHDPEHSYDAFSVLIRRVSEDFGAKIDFDLEFNDRWTRREGLNSEDTSKAKSGPQDLVALNVEDDYPSGAQYADKGYFLASVTYGGTKQEYGQDGYRACRNSNRHRAKPRKGLIIYLKSTLIREVELTTKGYRGSNPLFPSDPTANQFFSPEQFEAYRDLGWKIAAQMDRELVLGNLMEELTKTEDNELSEIAAKLEKLDQFA